MEKSHLELILADEQAVFSSNFNYIKRDVNLVPHLRSSDISIITGVRRCGKSTLLKQILDQTPEYLWFYLDLESPRLQTFTVEDFELCDEIWRQRIGLEQDRPVAVLLDEIQNVKGWERWVRYFSEKRRYKVFVTGSNSEMLSSELGTTLGGRYITLELFPFSFKEIAQHQVGEVKNWRPDRELRIALNGIIDHGLDYGLFPKPFLEKSRLIYPHLFHDIISRDIVRRKKIRKFTPLLELGGLLARDNTRLLNVSTTSKLIGLDDPRTLSKYLSFFEDAYLFFRLRRFSQSHRKQLRGASKCYCIDPVLADEVSAQRNRRTVALESIVHLRLRREREKFGFWISANGYEVDFVVEGERGELRAIQVCYDLGRLDTVAREIRALEAARVELKASELIIITRDFPSDSVKAALPNNIRIITVLEFLGLWAD